ncbi:anthranilate synthase family protein [Kineosporia rhizophila]|uniref:anthranilate synthase family protein n=1 Tax=Kineosporia rhizophila TaxID=84633 RepID=UPI001E33DE9C|nr:anthranilate synthase family protein [Kineosporia rhizophila]MCE0534904.1 anthranilate synthase family protein [Kineosporia rhizophila]
MPLHQQQQLTHESPANDLRARLEAAPAFAVLHRPSLDGENPPRAEVLIGEATEVTEMRDLPQPDGADRPVLAAIGFRQIAERGFEVVDDGTPILALKVSERITVDLAELLNLLPSGPETFVENGYDVDDVTYERIVRDVLEQEIAAGEGSNFVIHRCLEGRIDTEREPRARAALGVLNRLLRSERNAYWTFLLHTPSTTLVGATPERHVSLEAGVVTMNPISGTLRHPAGGFADEAARERALEAFLADEKERDELAMVVDEELKMMAMVTENGGRVRGPFLKPMAHLTHTEYVLDGRTQADVRDILTATMFAPTVTGSPIRNACRVIARHEKRGRRYYAGILALIDADDQGRPRIDAPILIRTAEIAPDGKVRVPAGTTLVRGSRPESELAETRAKAAGIMAALHGIEKNQSNNLKTSVGPEGGQGHRRGRLGELLEGRNRTLARYWMQPFGLVESQPVGGRVAVVDAEDDFTAMLGHLLRSLGFTVRRHSWEELSGPVGDELSGTSDPVVLGPGPGDPRDIMDRRIRALRSLAQARLAVGLPTVGICLGHQILSLSLGLAVSRLPVPDQGRQRGIDLFGRAHQVGFYNSFAVTAPPEPAGVMLALDEEQRFVHALRGRNVAGFQFHPESVLTTEGGLILAAELTRLSPAAPAAPAGAAGAAVTEVRH